MEQKLRDAFVSTKKGEWFCRAPVTIHTPVGAISTTPGVVYRTGRPFLGFDVGGMLDDWLKSGHLPPNIRIE